MAPDLARDWPSSITATFKRWYLELPRAARGSGSLHRTGRPGVGALAPQGSCQVIYSPCRVGGRRLLDFQAQVHRHRRPRRSQEEGS